MKSVISYTLILFVLSACGNSGNSDVREKKDTLTVYEYDTIIKYDTIGLPFAKVSGINNGIVSKGQLVNTGGMILENNKMNYKIISFDYSDDWNKNIYFIENSILL